MKVSVRIGFLACCVLGLFANVPPADAQIFCQGTFTTIVDFTPGTLPFPDGTNITSQFGNRGVIFSANDSDLPPEFQVSQGSSENYIQERTFYNLFRLGFTRPMRPVSVSVTLHDQNSNQQLHTLAAFDHAGNIVDVASFNDGGEARERFTLTVSSCKGIAFVVAVEDPLGASVVERITFTAGQ